MATYTNAPSVSAAVSASGSTITTLFTCAANSYAVISVFYNDATGGSTNTLKVGGRTVYTTGAIVVNSLVINDIYVGPSQAVQITAANGTSSFEIVGVQYTNAS